MATADDEIHSMAERLRSLKETLGGDFWRNETVEKLQRRLRCAIATYPAWGEDKLPQHQRARLAAHYEARYAYLLWPGRADD